MLTGSGLYRHSRSFVLPMRVFVHLRAAGSDHFMRRLVTAMAKPPRGAQTPILASEGFSFYHSLGRMGCFEEERRFLVVGGNRLGPLAELDVVEAHAHLQEASEAAERFNHGVSEEGEKFFVVRAPSPREVMAVSGEGENAPSVR